MFKTIYHIFVNTNIAIIFIIIPFQMNSIKIKLTIHKYLLNIDLVTFQGHPVIFRVQILSGLLLSS